MPRPLLVACGVALIALVAVFGVQNRRLREAQGTLIERGRLPREGLYVPVVSLPSQRGDTLVVGAPPPGERQLLIGLAAGCAECRASLPAWRTLVGATDDAPVRTTVIGLSLDSMASTTTYVDSVGLPIAVTRLAPRWWKLFRVSAVPALLLVDDRGVVIFARTGVLDRADAVDSVRAALHRPIRSDTAVPSRFAVVDSR